MGAKHQREVKIRVGEPEEVTAHTKITEVDDMTEDLNYKDTEEEVINGEEKCVL